MAGETLYMRPICIFFVPSFWLVYSETGVTLSSATSCGGRYYV